MYLFVFITSLVLNTIGLVFTGRSLVREWPRWRARLRLNEHGGPLVEYIFLIAVLSLTVILVVKAMGSRVSERTSMMQHQIICTDKNCNPG